MRALRKNGGREGKAIREGDLPSLLKEGARHALGHAGRRSCGRIPESAADTSRSAPDRSRRSGREDCPAPPSRCRRSPAWAAASRQLVGTISPKASAASPARFRTWSELLSRVAMLGADLPRARAKSVSRRAPVPASQLPPATPLSFPASPLPGAHSRKNAATRAPTRSLSTGAESDPIAASARSTGRIPPALNAVSAWM